MQKNHAEHLTRASIKDVIRATRGPVVMLHPDNPKVILMYFLPGQDVVSCMNLVSALLPQHTILASLLLLLQPLKD